MEPSSEVKSGVGILQLLTHRQSSLVPVLGKTSGWDSQIEKKKGCAKLGNKWVSIEDSNGSSFEVLPNCLSYLQVRLKRITDGGDHDVAIAEITGDGVWDESQQTVIWRSDSDTHTPIDQSVALYTGQLRSEGII